MGILWSGQMNPSSPADIARRVTAPDSVYPPDHELRILAEGYNELTRLLESVHGIATRQLAEPVTEGADTGSLTEICTIIETGVYE